MDLGIILAIIGSTFGIITVLIWLRTEANADRREISSILIELKDESKDFHGRLCRLEERYLQILESKK